MPKVISRYEAQKRGLKRFFTGKPCKHGHIAERYITRSCVVCGLLRDRTHSPNDYGAAGRRKKAAQENRRGRQVAAKLKLRAEQEARELKQEARRIKQQVRLEAQKKARLKRDAVKWQVEAPDREARKQARAAGEKRYWSCRPCTRKIHLEWYPAPQEKVERVVKDNACVICNTLCRREWYRTNREHRLDYMRRYWKTPVGALRSMVSGTISRMRAGTFADARKYTLLGYGAEELWERLVSTLPPGISIEEVRANPSDWHVDHIVPVVFVANAFSATEEGQEKAYQIVMDLENLRFLSAEMNLKKNGNFALNEEQTVVLDHLCRKYSAPELLDKILF